jgi:hypothetical protein
VVRRFSLYHALIYLDLQQQAEAAEQNQRQTDGLNKNENHLLLKTIFAAPAQGRAQFFLPSNAPPFKKPFVLQLF